MKITKIYIFFFLFLSFSFLAKAQTPVEIDKKEFKIEEKKDAFKTAWQTVKDGDDAFAAGSQYYHVALKYYIYAWAYNDNNPELNYKIGICYLFSEKKAKAIQFLKKAGAEKENVTLDYHYWMAQAYQVNLRFDEAIEEYETFINVLPQEYMVQFKEQVGNPYKLVENCRYAKKLINKPERIFIDNLGKTINTKKPEYSAIISADESVLIFTSRRENTTGGNRSLDDNKFFEDIYISKKNKDDEWKTAKSIGSKVNTKEHDATVSLSADGQTLIIYRSSSGNGDLFESKLKGNEWSKPRQYSKKLNTKYHESSASISPDGKTIYFVSNNPKNSLGKHDIFKATLDEKGDWDNIENIGAKVNTSNDELAIFLHPDGRTLYFSSNGHSSMGGFDIFKTELDDFDEWSEPVNLGYPINTPNNDLFFVISANGKHGYFSSEKTGGEGDADIYKITFLGEPKPTIQSNEDNLLASIALPIKEKTIEKAIVIKKIRLTILKGVITDAMTGEFLGAEIEIVNNTTGKLVSTFESNSETGKYLVPLPSGVNYGIAVKKSQYLFHSENFDIPKTANYQEITKDIGLLKMLRGSAIILRNIFFDTGKATLRPESNTELNRLVKLLTENISLNIEIQGHTDNIGGLDYNKKLSGNRAKSVVDYLIKNGISSARLKSKGYGYSDPIETNKTPEGRQSNRRVQFKIM